MDTEVTVTVEVSTAPGYAIGYTMSIDDIPDLRNALIKARAATKEAANAAIKWHADIDAEIAAKAIAA